VNLQLLLLLAYAAAMIGLGLWIGRRVTTSSSFFVAGRNLGPGLLLATLLAANIGAGSTVGAAGLGFRDGIAAWWWVGSAGIGTIILALWAGPRLWRLAKQHDLLTAGDYLDWRYGKAMRITVTGLLWLGTLTLLAGQLIAMAWILEAVAGVDRLTGCVIAGLVMTIYFASGGLLTSAWVNLVQLAVLVVGFAVALPYAWSVAGGSAALTATTPAADYWSFWQGGGSGWIYLPLLAPAFFVSPGLVQKVYGARDARSVRIGTLICGMALLAFAAVPALLGIIARSLHPDLVAHELALPTLLTQDLPLGLGTLGLAAVLSAEISSADAILFMLATSFSRDLYRRFLKPAASDQQVLRVARMAAIAGGCLGVVLAIVLETVIASLTIFYSLLSVSFFVPIVAGLLIPRARTPEVMTAVVAGVATLMAARLGLPVLAALPSPLANPTLLAILVSSLVFAVTHAGRLGRGSGNRRQVTGGR
jgi:SSS family solute:Na+ symporter